MDGFTQMTEVLRDARRLLALPNNDFAWSSWEDEQAALAELDGLIAKLQDGVLCKRLDLELLFLPTGPIQEVSLSSGWADEFLQLASRFDAAATALYGLR